MGRRRRSLGEGPVRCPISQVARSLHLYIVGRRARRRVHSARLGAGRREKEARRGQPVTRGSQT
eukprot:scaffold130464_cov60-Phaeocystis_antarctica.AAC.1